jgi:hypothetical protein
MDTGEAHIKISGEVPDDPVAIVLILTRLVEGMCRAVDRDPAYAVMALTTAAAVITIQNAEVPMSAGEIEKMLCDGAGFAAKAAGEMCAENMPTVQ